MQLPNCLTETVDKVFIRKLVTFSKTHVEKIQRLFQKSLMVFTLQGFHALVIFPNGFIQFRIAVSLPVSIFLDLIDNFIPLFVEASCLNLFCKFQGDVVTRYLFQKLNSELGCSLVERVP